MSLDTLREALPAYARDTRLNLGTVLANSPLPAQQVWGAAVACASAARNKTVLREISTEASAHLSQEAMTAALAAASIMGMNNIYYRAKHMLGDEEYSTIPARLRMQVIGNPGVDKVDFELWCLAVSAIGGCASCLVSHEKALRSAGLSRDVVHEALRIAAVVHATAVTISAQEALAENH